MKNYTSKKNTIENQAKEMDKKETERANKLMKR